MEIVLNFLPLIFTLPFLSNIQADFFLAKTYKLIFFYLKHNSFKSKAKPSTVQMKTKQK